MNFKFFILCILFTCVITSCRTTKPNGFTYTYLKDSNTGLDKRIDTDGYFISQRDCDSSFFSAFTFYDNGLYCSVTGTNLNEAVKCLNSNEKTALCKNLAWGLYALVGDTIKTQTLREEGITFCTIYRDYVIQEDKSIVNISDYVDTEAKYIGYMRNYPSFKNRTCHIKSQFVSEKKAKRNTSLCPYINKKWFSQ